MLRRTITGKRKWLVGSEDSARAAGIDIAGGWPRGVWKAPCGDFYAEDQQPDEGRGTLARTVWELAPADPPVGR